MNSICLSRNASTRTGNRSERENTVRQNGMLKDCEIVTRPLSTLLWLRKRSIDSAKVSRSLRCDSTSFAVGICGQYLTWQERLLCGLLIWRFAYPARVGLHRDPGEGMTTSDVGFSPNLPHHAQTTEVDWHSRGKGCI